MIPMQPKQHIFSWGQKIVQSPNEFQLFQWKLALFFAVVYFTRLDGLYPIVWPQLPPNFFSRFLYEYVPISLLLVFWKFGCLMFDGLEVIPNRKCWVKADKKKRRKGKNNFRNRCIAIVLLRLYGGVGLINKVWLGCCTYKNWGEWTRQIDRWTFSVDNTAELSSKSRRIKRERRR